MNHFRRILKGVLNRGLSTQRFIWEPNKLGRIADGRCTVRVGSTAVFATVVSSRKSTRTLQILPLQVHSTFISTDSFQVEFHERGLRFGARFRDQETAVGQMLERVFTPLFPIGFMFETSIRATVLASDGMTDAEVLAINAVSGAFVNSDIAVPTPIGACRVAKFNDAYFINPAPGKLKKADFVLTYAGTRDNVVLLEGFGRETASHHLCEMMELAKSEISKLIQEQLEFSSKPPKREIICLGADPTGAYRILDFAKSWFQSIYTNQLDVRERKAAIEEAKTKTEKKFEELGAWRTVHSRIAGSGCVSSTDMFFALLFVEDSVLKDAFLASGVRPDGRLPRDLRPSSCEVNVFPVLHGSAVFTCGESQAISVVTVANPLNARYAHHLVGSQDGLFSLSYQLLPYAKNEVSRFNRPRRGDSSTGMFISKDYGLDWCVMDCPENTLLRVMPSRDEFPFAVLVDIETTASDGASQMVALCSTIASLMDAGVPIKTPVAGVSFGAISSKQRQYFEHQLGSEPTTKNPDDQDGVLIVDVQESEELFGDMNFNICGTEEGITAFQLVDVIQGGVHMDTLKLALTESMDPIKQQLNIINDALIKTEHQQKANVSFVRIPEEYFASLLGPEGTNIRKLESETETAVVLNESEEKTAIYSKTPEQFENAHKRLLSIQGADILEGETYEVKIVRVMDYGAFVLLPTGFQALLHISEISEERIRSVADVFKEGETVTVKCLGRDLNGEPRLSMKAIETNSNDVPKLNESK